MTETVETPTEDPVEVPVDEAPVEEPTETPEETPTEDGAETPEEAPVEDIPDESEDEDSQDTDYNEYEHPALKQAVNLLKGAKIPVGEANAIFASAIETGDITKVDKEALVAKVGADQAEVIMVLAQSYYTDSTAQFEALTSVAYEITGDADTYNQVKDWANTKAGTDPEFAKDLQEIRDLMDTQKPRAIQAAVSELFDMYKADPGTTIEASLETGDSVSGTSGVEPLSLRAFTNEIEKAHREGKYEQKKKQLWARRQAGKTQGI
jgi:hypothetical protein